MKREIVSIRDQVKQLLLSLWEDCPWELIGLITDTIMFDDEDVFVTSFPMDDIDVMLNGARYVVCGHGLVVENLLNSESSHMRSHIREGTETELCLVGREGGIKISYSMPPILRKITYYDNTIDLDDFLFYNGNYVSYKKTSVIRSYMMDDGGSV